MARKLIVLHSGEDLELWDQTWVHLLVLTLTNCVSLGKSFYFPLVSLFCKMGIREQLYELNKVRYVKYLVHRFVNTQSVLAIIIDWVCFPVQSWFPRGVGSHLVAPWTREKGVGVGGCGSWNILLLVPAGRHFQGKFQMVPLPSGGLSSLSMGRISCAFLADAFWQSHSPLEFEPRPKTLRFCISGQSSLSQAKCFLSGGWMASPSPGLKPETSLIPLMPPFLFTPYQPPSCPFPRADPMQSIKSGELYLLGISWSHDPVQVVIIFHPVGGGSLSQALSSLVIVNPFSTL